MPAEHHHTRIYLAVCAVIAGLIYLLSPILAPFLIAAFLAYLGDPLVDRLESRGTGRTAGVAIVFFAMTVFGVVALLLTAPLIESQVRTLIKGIPQFAAWLNGDVVPFLEALSGLELASINVGTLTGAAAEHWDQIGGIVGVLASWLGNSTQLMLSWFAFATIVPVVTLYLLRDWDILVAKVNGLIPRQFEPKISELATEVDVVLAEFLRGQLLLMLAQAAYFSLGLALVGLDLALLIGVLAGAVSFVPYLGAIIGVSAGVLAAVMQFHELLPVIWVLLVFGIGQALEGMVLQPLLVGDRIGLHPVAVIFAVMVGGQLFGFVGILIALPVAAVFTVLLRHAHEFYVSSTLYGGAPVEQEPPSGPAEPEELVD